MSRSIKQKWNITGLLIISCIFVLSVLLFVSRSSSSDISINTLATTDPYEQTTINKARPLPSYLGVEGSGPIHMTINGATQGPIKGSVTAAGKEETIRVIGIEHEVVSPRDAASGLPTGKRQHSPVRITKRIDRSTPLLYVALVNNENLTDVTIKFYRTGSTGGEQQYYTITLVNAAVLELRESEINTESVSFVYEKIIWTWEEGGITAEDDWETPIA